MQRLCSVISFIFDSKSLTFSLEDELQNTCRAGHASETNLKVPEGLFWCHQLLPAFHYVFVALHFHNSQRHQQIRFKLTCICLNRYFLSQFTCDKLNEIIRTTCICIPISFQKLPVYVHKKLGSRLLRCQNIWTIYDLPHHQLSAYSTYLHIQGCFLFLCLPALSVTASQCQKTRKWASFPAALKML